MGFAKQQWMEQQERRYGSIDKVVCQNCVGDYALKNFVIENGTKNKCSYCQHLDICVEVEALIGEIMDGVNYEYDEAVNEMGWEDGEYVGADTWDTYDLFNDELSGEMELNNDLLEDIVNTVDMTTWCEKDPYQLRKNKEHSSMWTGFCRMVKEKTRYVFFRMPEENKYQEESAFLILDHIDEAVTGLKLFRILPAGTSFFRGRMHDSKTILHEAKDLCSPPHDKAKSNRMSAEGISIFYGASDVQTVVNEIYNSKYGYATVTSFINTRDITVLDLTRIKDIAFPSLFDKKEREYREPILFLRRLNADLIRPIEFMESIEYIPAQIVAEYFRFLSTYKGKAVDGIVYNSSKSETGICYALFFDHDQCLEADVNRPFPKTHEQILKMDSPSTCTYKVSLDLKLTKTIL